jgi:REP element-mobilizing transposase RayT
VERLWYWLLTWTTYGTWLPGEERGFVSNVRVGPGPEVRHNDPGTPYDRAMAGLRAAAQAQMKGEPVALTGEQAEAVVAHLNETAKYRGWTLLAAAVMWNHAHVVVAAPGDPDPAVLLRDFKSYAARRLNQKWGKPASGTWWTESGSRRKLPDDAAIIGAVEYVAAEQPNPLAVYRRPESGERGA